MLQPRKLLPACWTRWQVSIRAPRRPVAVRHRMIASGCPSTASSPSRPIRGHPRRGGTRPTSGAKALGPPLTVRKLHYEFRVPHLVDAGLAPRAGVPPECDTPCAEHAGATVDAFFSSAGIHAESILYDRLCQVFYQMVILSFYNEARFYPRIRHVALHRCRGPLSRLLYRSRYLTFGISVRIRRQVDRNISSTVAANQYHCLH